MSLLQWIEDYNQGIKRRRGTLENELAVDRARRLSQAAVEEQRQGQLAAPSVPLSGRELMLQVAESAREAGQPIPQENLANLAMAAERQDVGRRKPFTEQPSLLSYAPTTVPLTATDLGNSVAQAQAASPATAQAEQGGLIDYFQRLGLEAPVAGAAARDPETLRQIVVNQAKGTTPREINSLDELSVAIEQEPDPEKRAALVRAYERRIQAEKDKASAKDRGLTDAERATRSAAWVQDARVTMDGILKQTLFSGEAVDEDTQKVYNRALELLDRYNPFSTSGRQTQPLDANAAAVRALETARGQFARPGGPKDLGPPKTWTNPDGTTFTSDGTQVTPVDPTTVDTSTWPEDVRADWTTVMQAQLPQEEKEQLLMNILNSQQGRGPTAAPGTSGPPAAPPPASPRPAVDPSPPAQPPTSAPSLGPEALTAPPEEFMKAVAGIGGTVGLLVAALLTRSRLLRPATAREAGPVNPPIVVPGQGPGFNQQKLLTYQSKEALVRDVSKELKAQGVSPAEHREAMLVLSRSKWDPSKGLVPNDAAPPMAGAPVDPPRAVGQGTFNQPTFPPQFWE